MKPGPVIDDFTRKLTIRLWMETLAEIGPERFDAAFWVVIKGSTFRPDITEIRKAAGLPVGIESPLEKQAIRELHFLIAAMKLHGPYLKPIPGKIIATHNAAGQMLREPEREPEVKPPALSDRTERALLAFGGTREAALELLSSHPALCATEAAYRLKNTQDIEKRWVQAWR